MPPSAAEALSTEYSEIPTRPPQYTLRPTRQLGRIIGGRYRVEGLLGEGGTSRVFLARDLRSEAEELVVVKELRRSAAQDNALRAQFLQEARILLSLEHENIVEILSVERPTQEPPFLTLKALKGETLGDYLKREGQMPSALALSLLREAARALAVAHRAGIVHRDIKPDNLFLEGPVGAPTRLIVIDFGMADCETSEKDEGSSTRILGTAQYMAPEQILVEEMDARTDIYGLGIVLFRAITGELPFDTSSRNDLIRHQLFSPIPPASWLTEGLPWQVEKLIANATRKEPDARLSTMESFVTAIDHALGEAAEGRTPARLQAEAEEWAREISPDERDIYLPRSEQGRRAFEILAQPFGVYARPQTPLPLGEYE